MLHNGSRRLIVIISGEEQIEGAVSKIIYGLAALVLLVVKFAEGVPSLQPIGGSCFYEVGVIFGPAVLLDQSIAWVQTCAEVHRQQRERRRRAKERALRKLKQQQTKVA
jgi:hypothetical protein